MAILTLDSLLNCSSIPSFIGGLGDTPANPAYMIFNNTNAPTGWTKDTTHNNKALRVIGGANATALSPGGTSDFTVVLASGKTYPGTTAGTSPVSITMGQVNAYSPTTFSPDGGSIVSDTYVMSGPDVPTHRHTYTFQAGQPGTLYSTTAPVTVNTRSWPQQSLTTPPMTDFPTNFHAHILTGATNHTHTVTATQHNHLTGSSAPLSHSHPSTISANFSINYIDVIIARKS